MAVRGAAEPGDQLPAGRSVAVAQDGDLDNTGTVIQIPEAARSLRTLVDAVLDDWPEHASYLRERFAGNDLHHLEICDRVARMVLAIIGERLPEVVRHYRWTCAMMLDEEYHFRITGAYRHTSFASVQAAVYDDPRFMRRYNDGLLLSQVLWANHAYSIQAYLDLFLADLERDTALLEIGPGHGLLLTLAARWLRAPATGWDVSRESLAATDRMLRAVGVTSARLRHQDLLTARLDQKFDAVVASEVLEHLEHPATALRRLAELLRPGGRMFLNVPLNSPAPDHITLWRSPAEFHSLVTDAGLHIDTTRSFPMTGKTLQEAVTNALTVSCVVVCRHRRDQSRQARQEAGR